MAVVDCHGYRQPLLPLPPISALLSRKKKATDGHHCRWDESGGGLRLVRVAARSSIRFRVRFLEDAPPVNDEHQMVLNSHSKCIFPRLVKNGPSFHDSFKTSFLIC